MNICDFCFKIEHFCKKISPLKVILDQYNSKVLKVHRTI